MNIVKVARVCHATNREFCQTIMDDSQKPWGQAEEWQRQSAIKGVQFALENPNAPASAQHDAWLADKIKDGWIYGPVKDAASKEHPCLVSYAHLPLDQRIKDYLFKAVVKAFVDAEGEGVVSEAKA